MTAGAAIIEYEATGTFTNSAFPSAVAVGDAFVCRLAYNDAFVDSDSSTNRAFFNNALTLLDFKLGPNPAGNYAGGSLISPSSISVVKASNVHWIYIYLNEGFGTINGSVLGLQFYLLDYSHSSSINDVGSGQTLGSVLGGEIDLGEFRNSRLTLSAGKSNATATIASLNAVEPPKLAVSFVTHQQLRITWSTNATGYSLEMASSLLSPLWTTVTNIPTPLGNCFAVTVDAATTQMCYRLRKQ